MHALKTAPRRSQINSPKDGRNYYSQRGSNTLIKNFKINNFDKNMRENCIQKQKKFIEQIGQKIGLLLTEKARPPNQNCV